MNLDQIRSFLSVVELGNFAAAASSLYLTQSALGHRISGLEKELGVDLFVRGRGIRQVVLTEHGSRFIPIAREISLLWDDALGLAAADGHPEVRVACVFSLQDVLVDPIMKSLISVGARPYVASSNTRSAIKSLEAGDLDFAVIGAYGSVDEERCRVDVLAREGYVMVSRPDSPYGERVSFKTLDPAGEVYSTWQASCENWHRSAFGDGFLPTFTIENLSQMSPLLSLDPTYWAAVPSGVAANVFAADGYKISSFEERTPEREVRFVSRLPIMGTSYETLLEALRAHLASLEGFSAVS